MAMQSFVRNYNLSWCPTFSAPGYFCFKREQVVMLHSIDDQISDRFPAIDVQTKIRSLIRVPLFPHIFVT